MVEKNTNDTNNKPIKTYKAGLLTLSLWENEVENSTIKSFTFQRSYKDSEEKWQHTQSLKASDLPKLKLLINKAYEDSLLLEN